MKETDSKILASLFAEQSVLGVSEVTERIKDLLEGEFFALQVQGEVSNFKPYHSGHWYFTLKDSHSQLRAVFFKQWNRLMRFEPENGLEVRVRGRLSVYEVRGEYQLLVETMEPVGVGALQLAFEQRVKQLAAAGLFDEARKRPLPPLPRRIAIVTSPLGAVLHDMLQILERRNRGIDVLVVPVRVQGTGAAREIAEAIKLINSFAKKNPEPVDVIIAGRGGGSMEDLWAFNEEVVARAIFESEIPVVSAVGHETDFTIADFVADLRAPTPSAAAELVASESSLLKHRVALLQQSIEQGMKGYLADRQSRLRDLLESRGFDSIAQAVPAIMAKRNDLVRRAVDALQASLQRAAFKFIQLERRLAMTDFRASIVLKNSRLASIDQRHFVAIRAQMKEHRGRLAVVAGKLQMLSPLAVLGRGYALVKDEQGRLLSRASDLAPDQPICIRFEDGEVEAVAVGSGSRQWQ